MSLQAAVHAVAAGAKSDVALPHTYSHTPPKVALGLESHIHTAVAF